MPFLISRAEVENCELHRIYIGHKSCGEKHLQLIGGGKLRINGGWGPWTTLKAVSVPNRPGCVMISRGPIPEKNLKNKKVKDNQETFLCYNGNKMSNEVKSGPSEKVFRIEMLQDGQCSIQAASSGSYFWATDKRTMGLKSNLDESCCFIIRTRGQRTKQNVEDIKMDIDEVRAVTENNEKVGKEWEEPKGINPLKSSEPFVLKDMFHLSHLQLRKTGQVTMNGGWGTLAVLEFARACNDRPDLFEIRLRDHRDIKLSHKGDKLISNANDDGYCSVWQIEFSDLNNRITIRSGRTGEFLIVNKSKEFSFVREKTQWSSFTALSLKNKMLGKAKRRSMPIVPVEGSLLPEQIEHFYREGYLVLKNIVPTKVVEDAIKHINLGIAAGTISLGDGSDRPFTISGWWRSHHHVHGLLWRSPVYGMIEQLLAPRKVSVPKKPQVRLLPPRTDEWEQLPMTKWHVDGMKESNPAFSCLAGFPMSDWTKPYNGNFVVFPRSHKLIYKAIKDLGEDAYCMMRREKEGDGDRRRRLIPENPIQIIAEPGDAILAHPLLAHRAGPNYGRNIRYAVYMRVAVEGDQHLEVEPTSIFI